MAQKLHRYYNSTLICPLYKKHWRMKWIINSIIFPDFIKICAVTGMTKTYDDLYRLTVRAATNLQQFGCKRGSKIFVFSDNHVDMPPLIFAAICLGCPLVPLMFTLSQSECEYFMNITKPEFAICQVAFYPMLKKCFENLEINATIFTIDGQTDDSISTELLFQNSDNESNFE